MAALCRPTGDAYLDVSDALLLWTPKEYERREPEPKDSAVSVLTPEPMVACMRSGCRLEIHPSGVR